MKKEVINTYKTAAKIEALADDMYSLLEALTKDKNATKHLNRYGNLVAKLKESLFENYKDAWMLRKSVETEEYAGSPEALQKLKESYNKAPVNFPTNL